MKTKNIAVYGLLVALAMILSYIESLFPIPVPIYGIKIGLANLVVVAALYSMGMMEALILSVIRIILVGFTFGSLSTMMFALAGGLLSWLMMTVLKKCKLFSMIGVSVVGGISHNIGQLVVAVYVMDNINILYYFPFLLISGMITGILIGLLGAMIVKRINKFM